MARPSPVSDAVLGLFLGGERHAWSIDELHDSVRAIVGAADYSTVFRAVAALERDGVVDRLEVGDGKARFEAHVQHHEHVRCDACGRIAEVAGCVVSDASAAVRASTGFTVTSHRLLFTGLCPECAGPAG